MFYKFDIDGIDFAYLRNEFEAEAREMHKAIGRCLKKTAVTMNFRASNLIANFVSPRHKSAVKKRIKEFSVKSDHDSYIKLWYGLNSIGISDLRGRVSRIGSKKNPAGAIFSSRSSSVGTRQYEGGFIAQRGKYKSIFSRTGPSRWDIKEERVDIVDHLVSQIEDEVFGALPEVFFKHLKSDLKGRAAMRKMRK